MPCSSRALATLSRSHLRSKASASHPRSLPARRAGNGRTYRPSATVDLERPRKLNFSELQRTHSNGSQLHKTRLEVLEVRISQPKSAVNGTRLPTPCFVRAWFGVSRREGSDQLCEGRDAGARCEGPSSSVKSSASSVDTSLLPCVPPAWELIRPIMTGESDTSRKRL